MLSALMEIFFLTMGQAACADHGVEDASFLVEQAERRAEEALEKAKRLLEEAPASLSLAEKASKAFEHVPLHRGRVCRGVAPWEEGAEASPWLSAAAESKPSSGKASEKLSVLVSFSMPERSLKELFAQVTQAGGRLVVRGLLEDSFAKTKSRIQTLGIQVDVDPQLFERFNVKAVPFFVLQKAPHTHTLQGNVSVAFALEQMGQKV